ncbi:MAG: adenosylcobinamide-GDP ribazoletransferase [Pseudomonadota bacterium]|nr:adenosylcobinamide-GDP ribazoletransferase [Pseudomonadota bacterium]
MDKKEENIRKPENIDENKLKETVLDEESKNTLGLLERLKSNVNKQGWFSDLKICVCVLTRIPIYLGISPDEFSISEASRFFPIVGAFIGLLASVVLWIAGWFGFSPVLLALFALLTITLLTGALHEDGLADTFDGLGGGITRDQKLKIMRDSQIGSYGVMALLFSFGLRWTAYTEITELGFSYIFTTLIAVAAGSRAALPVIMYFVPVARDDGLSAGAGKPSFDRAITALLIGIGLVLFCLGFRLAVLALGVSLLVAGFFVYFVATRIGGQTGDVLGAAQQITEISLLLTIIMAGM